MIRPERLTLYFSQRAKRRVAEFKRSANRMTMTARNTSGRDDALLIAAILDDLRSAERRLKRSSSQFNRRQYIRTIFSMVEGVCSILRQKAKEFLQSDLRCKSRNVMECKDNREHHQKNYDKVKDCYHELSLLSDTVRTLDNTGKLTEQPQRLPFVNSVAFSLRSWAEHTRFLDCSHFFADNGWSQFRLATKVRDRITHPKSIRDLTISNADLALVEQGCEWFVLAVHEIVRSFHTRFSGEQPSIERARKKRPNKPIQATRKPRA